MAPSRPDLPSRRHYSLANFNEQIDTSLSNKDIPETLALLSEYAAAGNRLPTKPLNEVYQQIRTNKDPFLVHEFTQLVPASGYKVLSENFNRAIQLYIQSGDTETALSLIRDIQVANAGEFILSYETLEALLLSAKYQKDAEIALQVVQTMQETHKKVYARSLGLLLSTILQADDYEALHWFYKNAAVPGHIVLDDHSYLGMAALAAANSDFAMCQWAALRMRRRQRALNIEPVPSQNRKLFVYLIESAAGQGEYKAACRYLVRLRDAAGPLSAHDLPVLVRCLGDSAHQLKLKDFFTEMFGEMCGDAAANEAVKSLMYGVLLASCLRHNRYSEATELHAQAVDGNIVLNRSLRLLIVELGCRIYDWPLIESMACNDVQVQEAIKQAAESLGMSHSNLF